MAEFLASLWGRIVSFCVALAAITQFIATVLGIMRDHMDVDTHALLLHLGSSVGQPLIVLFDAIQTTSRSVWGFWRHIHVPHQLIWGGLGLLLILALFTVSRYSRRRSASDDNYSPVAGAAGGLIGGLVGGLLGGLIVGSAVQSPAVFPARPAEKQNGRSGLFLLIATMVFIFPTVLTVARMLIDFLRHNF